MASRTKAQIEARVCVSGEHLWVEGQQHCAQCKKSRRLKRNKVNRKTKRLENREAGFCYSGKHSWIEGQYTCVECKRESELRRYKENPERYRGYCRKFKYGSILEGMPNNCEVCGKDNGQRSLCVDHDHTCCPGQKSCGKCIRGFLCSSCNKAIGFAKDDSALLEKLALYLRERK